MNPVEAVSRAKSVMLRRQWTARRVVASSRWSRGESSSTRDGAGWGKLDGSTLAGSDDGGGGGGGGGDGGLDWLAKEKDGGMEKGKESAEAEAEAESNQRDQAGTKSTGTGWAGQASQASNTVQ